jgi:hypothetical protein
MHTGAVVNKDTATVARSDAPRLAAFANYFTLLKSITPALNWMQVPDRGTGPGIQGTPEELAALKAFRGAAPTQ